MVVVFQLLSHVPLFATPWITAQASLSFTISQNLLTLMSIESVMPSNHLILCHPLFLLPSIFLSIRVFSNESGLCIWWSKYGSFSFSISPSSEYSSLISFRIDWLHLFFLSKGLSGIFFNTILWKHRSMVLSHSMVQLSHPYMTTGKTIALTRWTFVSIVISLLFNMLSKFVIAFLPRSTHLLISRCSHCPQWFWSPRK